MSSPSLEVVICATCRVRVIPKMDGSCPACQGEALVTSFIADGESGGFDFSKLSSPDVENIPTHRFRKRRLMALSGWTLIALFVIICGMAGIVAINVAFSNYWEARTSERSREYFNRQWESHQQRSWWDDVPP